MCRMLVCIFAFAFVFVLQPVPLRAIEERVQQLTQVHIFECVCAWYVFRACCVAWCVVLVICMCLCTLTLVCGWICATCTT